MEGRDGDLMHEEEGKGEKIKRYGNVCSADVDP